MVRDARTPSLASERHRVAHPFLWLQEIAVVFPAAGCQIAPISNSSIDGHVALCPSIAIRSLLGECIVTDALVPTRRFMPLSIAGKS